MAGYRVKVPEGVGEGDDFVVAINGMNLTVTCPNAFPGMYISVNPPEYVTNLQSTSSFNNNRLGSGDLFEVVVPRPAVPGEPFALRAGGARVLVTCPLNAFPGQRIQFKLPKGLVTGPDSKGPKNETSRIKLSYDKDGWCRTIRASDSKFQWSRLDSVGGIDTLTDRRFDPKRSAFVARLNGLDDDDFMRRGSLILDRPEQGVVESRVYNDAGRKIVSHRNIVDVQSESFESKERWFHQTCRKLRGSGLPVVVEIRRNFLLNDSINKIMSMTLSELRRNWRIYFTGEDGLDAGGLTREWFKLVTDEIFNPDLGMWVTSEGNQMCLDINPASSVCCPEDHLIFFRVVGRVLGRALFDGQLVHGHMSAHLYKHLLGWPVSMSDLADVSLDYHNSLMETLGMGDDIEFLYATFSMFEEEFGIKREVELVPGGANIPVTRQNVPEYVEACMKYKLFGRVEAQLNELILGFLDVV